MSKYPHLFAPIKIAGHTYKNRILAAPMLFGFYCLEKGSDDRVYKIIEDRAKGGVAEVIIGETPINCADAPDMYFPWIEIDYTRRKGSAFDSFKKYADIIKKHNTIALIELFHAGHAKDPLPLSVKVNPWGPMGFTRPDGVTVEAFDDKKMKKVRDDFVICSQFMKEAGFDGICIHGGHGFLFTQFLSPSSNQRTDEYGGNLFNRGRFPRDIIGDIKKNLGKDFIVELRINGADLVEGGTTNDETAEFCSTLEGLADIIHISSGFKSKGYETQEFSSTYNIHGVNVERAAVVKKKTKVPVTVVGGINSPEFAEQIIAGGKVDFVSLGRQLIADPEFANKAKAGRGEDIKRCIRCYHCYPPKPFPPPITLIKMLRSVDNCSLNPVVNNEPEVEALQKPTGSRNVLVVGGGPGGMQAAITAADRGHKVTLVEKDNVLGGILYFADTDTHKEDLKNFKDLLIREVGKRKIKVLLNTEANPDYIKNSKADAVILAIGALPAMPPIPGIYKAMHTLDLYKKDAKIGKKIIMVGGGLAGCETAIHLADTGHEVTIIEMQKNIAPEAFAMALAAIIGETGQRKNITIKTNCRCTGISATSVKVINASGTEEVINGDNVVCSLGMSAGRKETEALRNAAGDAIVFEIGDCVRGAKVYEAVQEGFLAAMKVL